MIIARQDSCVTVLNGIIRALGSQDSVDNARLERKGALKCRGIIKKFPGGHKWRWDPVSGVRRERSSTVEIRSREDELFDRIIPVLCRFPLEEKAIATNGPVETTLLHHSELQVVAYEFA